MISLRHLERYYKAGGRTTWVLRDIHLEIARGEFVTIMGPSGAGKTTLLNIIGMLDQPDGGEYYFEEEPVHMMSEKRRTALHRTTIGFVFQAYHLIDELTVAENIETPLIYQKVKRRSRAAIVADFLDKFNIVAKKDLFPHQLSGGQQQLVGVARAMAGRPKLLLADEPTGNLHSAQGEMIMGLLSELHDEGTTIIQVTHSEKNATYGTRTIQLVDGFIQSDTQLPSGRVAGPVANG